MRCVSSQYRALVRCPFFGFQADNKICFHLSEQKKNCKRFESQDTQTTSLESVTGVWNLPLCSELLGRVCKAHHLSSCSVSWKGTIVSAFWHNFIYLQILHTVFPVFWKIFLLVLLQRTSWHSLNLAKLRELCIA